jgi:FMN-dependent NADH-azoreductase
MKTLLKITASMTGSSGYSAQLAEEFAQNWLLDNPGARIVTRDLFAEPVPHLTAERFQAFATPASERTPAQEDIVAYSDALIAELNGAEVIVFAVPMYNFSVPSTLRDYFDHIARAGVTFRYTAEGPKGLLEGKQTYVFIARGGVYPAIGDTQTPYLRQFLSFIGITDVQFVYAEGLALGADAREKSLAGARQAIARFEAVRKAA